MAYKLTGLTDIAIGSWEYYKARKALNEGNISEETALSRKRYNRTKVGIGALKLAIMGAMTQEIVMPMLNNHSFSGTDIGLLSAFAAGYAVLGVSIGYSSILNDEASNYKYNQSALEKKFNFKMNSNNNYELDAGESYQLFMFGNKIATGNPVDSFLFKIKNKVFEWQSNMKIEQDPEYHIIKSNIHKMLNKIGISNFINNIAAKGEMKKEAYDTIKIHADPKSKVNEEFRKYMESKKSEISSNEDDVKGKLKEINQEAILKAYQKLLVQNLQLFFAQVMNDYNKGVIHKELIQDFAKLNAENTKKKDNVVLFKEYEKISKLATKMLNGDKMDKQFKTPVDILRYFDSKNITKDGIIKIIDFNNTFYLEKKAILNEKNGLLKNDKNIYEDKKSIGNVFTTDLDFSKLIGIKKPKIEITKKDKPKLD